MPGGPPPQPQNGLGLTSMIMGIAAIPLLCCVYLAVPIGAVAAVLGFLGKRKADEGLATNRGMALAGIITGLVAVVIGVGLIIASFVFDGFGMTLPDIN